MNVVTTPRILQDVWASSANDAWAVGYSIIVHWDGSGAPVRSNFAAPTLWRVVGFPGSSELWAAGENFAVLRRP
jgi:hypothetical protein